MPVFRFRERSAHFRFGPLCSRRLLAPLIRIEFAVGQKAALLVEPRRELVHPAAQNLRLRLLRNELPVELAATRGYVLSPVAFLGELASQCLDLRALVAQ